MDKSTFQGMPKFKTPQEEIEFLRAHVQAREEELIKMGHFENANHSATLDVLDVYKEIPIEDILHKKNIIPIKETEGIVLALKPEPHDKVMEELLGILMTKGIKNALEVIGSMGNPHIEDDFHRILVQYLKTGGEVDNFKEGTPLYKSINMTLFEITLPPPSDESDKSKGFKEFIGAMEQFYAGMNSISMGKDNKQENYFTLEVALSVNTDQVVIYAGIPDKYISLFEKQILSFYHDAKVFEVKDDYNVFNENGGSVGAYAVLSERGVMPIKTYDNIEHDPMNIILNVFSKLQTAGEGAAIQLVIAPAGDKFINEFHHILDDVKDGMSVKYASDNFYKFKSAFLKAGKHLIFGESKGGENADEKKEKYIKGRSAVDEGAAEKIGNKMKSTIMKANIRVVASADTKTRAEAILKEIESSFNQFENTRGNRMVFKRQMNKQARALFHDFTFRLFSHAGEMPLSLRELTTIYHFPPKGIESTPNLKQSRFTAAAAPLDLPKEGLLLGTNHFRGIDTSVTLGSADRLRHLYVIGQTGTGKSVFLKNLCIQDIQNGEGACFIDPHGNDIIDILAAVPPHRYEDVIYFDPAYLDRPFGLNLLEYDPTHPEQKTFIVNEILAIFRRLYGDTPESMGPAFEQYFRNATLLVMEDPASGSTMLDIARVLSNSSFRDLKLSRSNNPIVNQFWQEIATKAEGEASLQNIVPYITNKFDDFTANDFMRPIIGQQNSSFNFRNIMDTKKILLVNLSKGRLGERNANLLGLILVGKLFMAALSRADSPGKDFPPFYLYIDEFQNITTDSIPSILSEARKYKLSLTVAHQFLAQIDEKIRDAVFGNVGSMAVFRVGQEDGEFFAKQFAPVVDALDFVNIENYNAYIRMLSGGVPQKPFNIQTPPPIQGNVNQVDDLRELSYLTFGRDRATIESTIRSRYMS